MKSKGKALQKMIQHTHYDRKLGKLVRTMVPQTKEHETKVKNLFKGGIKRKESTADYQHRVGKAYSE